MVVVVMVKMHWFRWCSGNAAKCKTSITSITSNKNSTCSRERTFII